MLPWATGIWLACAISRIERALRVAFSTVTFPCVVVRASSWISGDANASKNARASSTPGSVSMMIRFGFNFALGGVLAASTAARHLRDGGWSFRYEIFHFFFCRQGRLCAELCCCQRAAGASIPDRFFDRFIL